MHKRIALWYQAEIQDARDQFDDEVAFWFKSSGFLDPLPAELVLAEKPYTGKNLYKFEQYDAMIKSKIRNAMDRAKMEFQSGEVSASAEEMPLTYRGGSILPLFTVLARRNQEILETCDHQVKTRVTPYHEALQAFHSAIDKKIHVIYDEVYQQLLTQL